MRVLSYGSLNIDRNYYVEAVVKQGETISVNRITESAGGKGLNQSLALARAGAEVYHAGKIGYDGQFLVDLLASSGVNTQYIQQDDSRANGHALIQKDASGDNAILVYGGTNTQQTKADIQAVLRHFSAGDVMVLQNEINELDYLLAEGKQRGLDIYLNPSPVNEAIEQADLTCLRGLILNEHEARAITGKETREAMIAYFQTEQPNLQVVLTLGKEGSVFIEGETVYEQEAILGKTVDTTGAGDTFTGFFLAALVSGLEIKTCLKQASYAAALAVRQVGAAEAIPCRADVLALMENAQE